MSQNPDHNPHVRRVVLPSGRAIEVVYFNPRAPEMDPIVAPAAPGAPEALHICPACAGRLVYPLDWEEATATQWEVELRCPDCEWYDVGIYPQDVVDRFDDELDRGTDALVADLNRLTRANMEEETERFSRALASDAVWPMDF